MKKLFLISFFLIITLGNAHGLSGMEADEQGSAGHHLPIKVNQLLYSPKLNISNEMYRLVYLSYYANALLKQDEIMHKIRTFIAAKDQEAFLIREYCGEWASSPFDYEMLAEFFRHPVLFKLNSKEKLSELSDEDLEKIRALKKKFELSERSEFKLLAQLCARVIVSSHLPKYLDDFSRFINEFHIATFVEGQKTFLHNLIDADTSDLQIEGELETLTADMIKDARYSEMVDVMKKARIASLNFGQYAYLLVFYYDLPPAGQHYLADFYHFAQWQKAIASDSNSDAIAQRIKDRLQKYDEQRPHLERLYQEILKGLKESLKNYPHIQGCLEYQRSLKNGKEGPSGKRMPDAFPSFSLPDFFADEPTDDWLPAQPKKAVPKGQGKKKKQQKSAAKGKGKTAKRTAAKAKGVPLPGSLKASAAKSQPVVKEVAFDGSFVIEDNNEYMVAADQKNQMTVRVLKTDKENSVVLSKNKVDELEMTPWVKQWFENPKAALQDQGYLDPKSNKFTNPDQYGQAIAYHTPPAILLKHLAGLAQQRAIESRRVSGKEDILFTMPVVNFYDNESIVPGKKWETGVAAWIVNSADQKTIYHAEFRPATVSKMIQDYMQAGYVQVSFPSLQEVQEYEKK